MGEFSHLDGQGKITMVDVGEKQVTRRSATARTIVHLPPLILDQLEQNDIHTKKGPVFQTAIIAGIMAAKKTGELIPLCHSLTLDNCNITITINDEKQVEILCTANITAKTGVEMEALTGASVAALTISDMRKALSHDIIVSVTRLVEKTGGKNDFKQTS